METLSPDRFTCFHRCHRVSLTGTIAGAIGTIDWIHLPKFGRPQEILNSFSWRRRPTAFRAVAQGIIVEELPLGSGIGSRDGLFFCHVLTLWYVAYLLGVSNSLCLSCQMHLRIPG